MNRPTRCSVWSRRRIHAPTGERVVTGYSQDGAEVFRPVLGFYGPGSQVTLPATEVARLRALGFLTA